MDYAQNVVVMLLRISLEAASGDAEVACNENFNIGP